MNNVTLKALSHFLCLSLLVQSSLLTKTVYAKDMQFEEDATAVLNQINSIEPTQVQREILGGKIIKKNDGAEIFAECVETASTGECEKVQYVLKDGFMKKAITPVVLMKEILTAYQVIKENLKKSVQDAIDKNSKVDPESPDYFPATNATYEFYNDTSFVLPGAISIFGGLIGLICLGTGGIPGAITFLGLVVLSWTGPVLLDLTLAPFKAGAYSIKKMIVKIHNKKIKKKYNKKLKRISLALKATSQESNKEVLLSESDFDDLVKIFEQVSKEDAKNPQTLK